MPIVLTDSTNYTAIANAIREKNGTNETYKPSEMASAIIDIESAGSTVPVLGWQTLFYGYSKADSTSNIISISEASIYAD